jgi:hypothetical protein
MNYDLIFLLEEPSMQDVLEIVLPKIVPADIIFKCVSHQGKQDLAKSIPKKIKAFQNLDCHTRFIIVHDRDSHDCKVLKSELATICRNAGDPSVLIRIICQELESWFLGDLAAVETAYQLKANSLGKKQTSKKYRDPDRLNSAKQELKTLVKEYYPGTHAKKIACHLSLEEGKNRSVSFRIFLEGIAKLLKDINERD